MESSEHIMEETPESSTDENMDEQQRTTSEQLLNTGEPEPVQETSNEVIKQLIRELESAYNTEKKRDNQMQELKQAKYVLQMAKVESEKEKDEEIDELSKRIDLLKLHLEEEWNIKRHLEGVLHKSDDKINYLIDHIHRERQTYNRLLERRSRRIEQLKAKICKGNCVIDVILRICQTKVPGVNFPLCSRQLEKIIIKKAADIIEKNDLKCDRFMEILEKYEIVARVADYKYPSEIDEAWGRLMSIDSNERVIILGIITSVASGKGHAKLCDLDTRNHEGLNIYSPDRDEADWTNKEIFKDDALGNDGLRLYSVKLEKLISIIEEYKDILSNHWTI